MAHHIFIDEGIESVMLVREKAWHGLGTVLDNPATSQEAIIAANLDWEVVKAPLFSTYDNKIHALRNKCATIRKDWVGKDKPYYGIVSNDYNVVQNKEAFNWFDSIVEEGKAMYHTAGALFDGQIVWISAKLPVDIELPGNDIVEKYLLLTNSHDGSSAIRIFFTPIRVVCFNTLTASLQKHSKKAIRIEHTKYAKEKLASAKDVIKSVYDDYKKLEDTYFRLAERTLAVEVYEKYLTEVLIKPFKQKINEEKQKMIINLLFQLFQRINEHNFAISNTWWAAYNSVTEYIDYYMSESQFNDRWLTSIWMGNAANLKQKALELAVRMMKHKEVRRWTK